MSIVCPWQHGKNLNTFEIHVVGHPRHNGSSTALWDLGTLTQSSNARDMAQLHGILAIRRSQKDVQQTRRTQQN